MYNERGSFRDDTERFHAAQTGRPLPIDRHTSATLVLYAKQWNAEDVVEPSLPAVGQTRLLGRKAGQSCRLAVHRSLKRGG